MAGPSTEQGSPSVIAVVLDSLGLPSPRVEVNAYRLAVQTDSALEPPQALKVASLRTDSTGTCRFENLISGNYSFEALGDSGASALISGIPVPELSKSPGIDTLILSSPGALCGVVTRGGILGVVNNQALKDAFIQVKIAELDRFMITGQNGFYSFAGLPAASYTILCYATDGFFTTIKKDVPVVPGGTTVLDTILLSPVPRLLPPQGFSARLDSAMQSVVLRWNKVKYADLRWYEVERIDPTGVFNRTWATPDTTSIDSVSGIPAGTILYYVVRSIDSAFNKSLNAGPAEVTVQ
jgi:hypothetical protein